MNAERGPKPAGELGLHAAGQSEDAPAAPARSATAPPSATPASTTHPPSNRVSGDVQGSPPTGIGAEHGPGTTTADGAAGSAGYNTALSTGPSTALPTGHNAALPTGRNTAPATGHNAATMHGRSTSPAVSAHGIDHPACPEPREHWDACTTGSHRIADPDTLRRAYEQCRRTAAVHGRTYYLATRLLPAERRPAVHALYAFARMVDDIVDGPALQHAPAAVLDAVEFALRASWSPSPATLPSVLPQLGATVPAESPDVSTTALFNSPRSTATRLLESPRSSATTPHRPADPVPDIPLDTAPARPLDSPRLNADTPLDPPHSSAATPLGPRRLGALPAGFGDIALALTDTVARFAIDPRHFWTFLDSMRMDVPGSPLFRNRYPTMAALDEYMRGSAAAIGLQLLPVLGTVVPRAAAEPAAAALGNAFQLTNFLRDIGEDLERGRIYLPADELAAFGVDEERLVYCHRTRSTDRRVRRALAHLIAVNRDLYRRAHPGIELLSPRVRPGIRTAATVYAAILERIEDSGYNVFARRAVVPGPHRLRLAAGAALRR